MDSLRQPWPMIRTPASWAYRWGLELTASVFKIFFLFHSCIEPWTHPLRRTPSAELTSTDIIPLASSSGYHKHGNFATAEGCSHLKRVRRHLLTQVCMWTTQPRRTPTEKPLRSNIQAHDRTTSTVAELGRHLPMVDAGEWKKRKNARMNDSLERLKLWVFVLAPEKRCDVRNPCLTWGLSDALWLVTQMRTQLFLAGKKIKENRDKWNSDDAHIQQRSQLYSSWLRPLHFEKPDPRRKQRYE